MKKNNTLKRLLKNIIDFVLLISVLAGVAFIISYGLWFAAAKMPGIFSLAIIMLTSASLLYLIIKKMFLSKGER